MREFDFQKHETQTPLTEEVKKLLAPMFRYYAVRVNEEAHTVVLARQVYETHDIDHRVLEECLDRLSATRCTLGIEPFPLEGDARLGQPPGIAALITVRFENVWFPEVSPEFLGDEDEAS